MKGRRLVLQATVMGFTANLVTITVGNPATERELKTYTDLVCPQDNKKPHYQPSGYKCDCGFTATTWQGLKRVLKGTTKPLDMPTLTKGNNEVEVAKIYKMSLEAFAKIADFTRGGERPVSIDEKDQGSIANLYKMVVAQAETGHVIILKWNDTKEEVVALLTTTQSGRIVVREIVPPNLVVVDEGLMLDRKMLSAKDVEEAKQFLKQIPDADKLVLEVTDYRVKQFEVHAPEEQKVMAISNIMEKAKQRKDIVDKVNKREIIVEVKANSKKKKKK